MNPGIHGRGCARLADRAAACTCWEGGGWRSPDVFEPTTIELPPEAAARFEAAIRQADSEPASRPTAVRLRDGVLEARGVVNHVLLILGDLASDGLSGIYTLYNLGKLARGVSLAELDVDEHQRVGLSRAGLCDYDGVLNTTIRNILRNAIVFEGGGEIPRVVSPLWPADEPYTPVPAEVLMLARQLDAAVTPPGGMVAPVSSEWFDPDHAILLWSLKHRCWWRAARTSAPTSGTARCA